MRRAHRRRARRTSTQRTSAISPSAKRERPVVHDPIAATRSRPRRRRRSGPRRGTRARRRRCRAPRPARVGPHRRRSHQRRPRHRRRCPTCPARYPWRRLRRWTSSRPSADITAIADRTVLQPLGAHLGPGDGGDHPVVVVDDVDQFVASSRGHRCMPTIRPWNSTRLRDEARDLLDDMVALAPHAAPVARARQRPAVTRESVLEALDGLPLDVTLHETTSGIAALLDGGKPGPTVLLRGDMDALPLHRGHRARLRVAQSTARMHACGHDTHTAMLVGAAKLLCARRADIAGPGAVHVPARRGGPPRRPVHARRGPARRARPLADGTRVAGHRRVRAAHHVDLPTGWLSCRGRLDHGVGRHAAHHGHRPRRPRQRAAPRARPDPDRLRDRAGAADDGHPPHRRVRPGGRHRRPITAGTDQQHHPRDRRDRGHHPRRQRAHPRARCTTASAGSPRASPRPTTPRSTSRSSTATRSPSTTTAQPTFALGVARELVGADKIVRLPNPVMGAEDFSYVLQQVPGAMVFLGGTPRRPQPGHGRAEPLEPGGVRRGRRWSPARRCTPRMALSHLGVAEAAWHCAEQQPQCDAARTGAG